MEVKDQRQDNPPARSIPVNIGFYVHVHTLYTAVIMYEFPALL